MDAALDWLVVVLPTLLSLWGVLVTLEPLDKRHKAKWRAALIACGLLVSTLTYWQQAKARVRATGEAREFHEQQIQEEDNSANKFNALVERFNALVAERRQKRLANAPPPTAEEIASAVSQKLKDMQIATSVTTPSKNPSAPVTAAVQPQPAPRSCRGDRLNGCSDEELLEWGKPLVSNIEAVERDYMTDLKKLDEIKTGNWLRELVGVGDKDSRWLKAYAQAQDKATNHFRDCCAESALEYHRELTQRVGGGQENTGTYEWVQQVTMPSDSKEYKKAKQDAGKIIDVLGDLRRLPIDLQIAQIQRR